MKKSEAMNKYGLREYSFEIGSIDDSSETVAIVGIEYSSVSEDEKFYRKEDVDSLLASKDAEILRLKQAIGLNGASEEMRKPKGE
jgi:hypothetical protein